MMLPGSPYDGMDRYAAREKIVADLEERGLLVEVKEHTNCDWGEPADGRGD